MSSRVCTAPPPECALPRSNVSAAPLDSDTSFMVRERAFPPASIDLLISALRDERATGLMLIEWGEGGIRSVRFHERTQIVLDKQY